MSTYFKDTPHDDQIHIIYESRVVRLRIDSSLTNELKQHYFYSLGMSYYIHKMYKQHFSKELDITKHSLALEILIHVAAYNFSAFFDYLLSRLGFSKQNRLRRFFQYVISHVVVIDCGEKAIDTNRFVFDWLSLIYPIAYPFFTLLLFLFPAPQVWQ